MLTWKIDPILEINLSPQFVYSTHFYAVFVNKTDFITKHPNQNQILQRSVFAGGEKLGKTVRNILEMTEINLKNKLERYIETERIFEKSYRSWFENEYFPLILLRVLAHYSNDEKTSLKRIYNSIDYVGSYMKRGIFYLPKDFSKITSPKFMHFYGIVFGDGNMDKYGKRIAIVDGNSKAKELDNCLIFLKEIEKHFLIRYVDNVKIKKYNKGNRCMLRVNSKTFCRFISFFFQHPPGKKKFVKLPNIIKQNNDTKKHFLIGLFDSDGGYRGKISLSNKNKGVLVDVKRIFNEFGIRSNIRKMENGYSLSIPRRDSLLYAKRIGCLHPNKQKDLIKLLRSGTKHTFFSELMSNSKDEYQNYFKTNTKKDIERTVRVLKPWGHKVRIMKRECKDINRIQTQVKKMFGVEVKDNIIYSQKLSNFLNETCVYSPPWKISDNSIDKLKGEWNEIWQGRE